MKELFEKFAGRGRVCETETEYSEPQFFVDLPKGRCMEICHEEHGLGLKDQYWSVRIHCNESEYDHDLFAATYGVIDQAFLPDIDAAAVQKIMSWATNVCTSTKDNELGNHCTVC